MRLNRKNGNDDINLFVNHLIFEEVTKLVRKDYKIKYTYLNIFLYLRFNNENNCTSLIPGNFKPYAHTYKSHWIEQIFSLGLSVLCKNGLISKQKHGEYKTTEEGERLFSKFMILYNNKQRELNK